MMNNGRIESESANEHTPRILFKPGNWMTKIDFINHLVLFNNVLIAVMSEKDGGKTAFSNVLLSNMDKRIQAVSMTVEALCSREDVLAQMAALLQATDEINMAALVSKVNERKSLVLIIIDNAHYLPEPLIEEMMLALKNQGDSGFFHLCFIADNSLTTTLNHLSNTQFRNLTHMIELGGLSESETRTYVLQRAMNAHWIHKPLGEAQYKQFYQLTKGNLAKINSSLESFIKEYKNKKLSAKKKLIRRSSVLTGTAIILAVFYVNFSGIYQFYQTRTFNDNYVVRGLLVKANQERSQPLESHIASWNESATLVLVEDASPKKLIIENENDDELDAMTNMALVDKVVVIPTIKSAKEGLKASLFPKEQEVAVLESQLTEVPKMRTHSVIKEKVALKKSEAKAYTIQLIASHRISDIHRFRKNNQLIDHTKVRHFSNSKGDWYVLTLGEFENRTSAQSQTNQLPEHLAKLKPWVRAVQGLPEIG